MTKKKNLLTPSSETIDLKNTLYVPQLCIPYEMMEYGTVNIVPKQIDEGLFRIRTPYEFSLDVGKTVSLKTKLKLKLPKYVDMSPCKGIHAGDTTTVFPRAIIHGHLDSIYDLLIDNGIVVLGPRVLSANISNDKELIIVVQNNGKKMFTARAGMEIAELYFTITPVSTLKLIIDQDMF